RGIRGTDIRIVNAQGMDVGERTIGEIWVRSDSLMSGYFNDSEATQETLANGWLHTGDLGYLAEGDLFVTGRKEEIIIRGGQNVYAFVVEDLAGQVDGVRPGCVAAVGVRAPALETEQLVVVAESKLDEAAWPDLQTRLQAAFIAAQIAVDRVVVV